MVWLFLFRFFFLLIQCGQGSTKDQLKVTRVDSLSDTRVKNVAAGLWHTLCITVDGRVYAFGGNQFGQLGTGAEEAEVRSIIFIFVSLEWKHQNSGLILRCFCGLGFVPTS